MCDGSPQQGKTADADAGVASGRVSMFALERPHGQWWAVCDGVESSCLLGPNKYKFTLPCQTGSCSTKE